MPERKRRSLIRAGALLTVGVLAPCLTLSATQASTPQAEDLGKLSLEELLSISVASKKEEPVQTAPASVTVITAEQIKALGARDLTDVLALVPGFDVRRNQEQNMSIAVRGIAGSSGLNERLLIMIDGVRLGDIYNGGFSRSPHSLDLASVERIEIIHGPGSALYGAGAFAGVINVITKRGSDIRGLVVDARGGSYGTVSADAVGGEQVGPFDVAAHLGYARSDGQAFDIAHDNIGQSGTVRDPYERFTANVKLRYSDSLELSASGGLDRNPGYLNILGNIAPPQDTSRSSWAAANLDYRRSISKGLEWHAKVYAGYFRWGQNQCMVYPAGMLPPFPDGLWCAPLLDDLRWGADTYARYSVTQNLEIIGGLSAETETSENSDHVRNGYSTDVPATQFFLNPRRNIVAGYFQADWRIARALRLVTGLRADHYSDFGTTVNPRAVLVYSPGDKFWTKAIFGTAFRAPTYRELYAVNNPAVNGDPANKPETLRSFELALGAAPSRKLTAQAAVFYTSIDDVIQATRVESGNLLFENHGTERAMGVEAEVKARVSPRLTITGNYTYTHAQNTTEGQKYDAPFISPHLANLMLTRGLSDRLQLSVLGEFHGDRTRYVLAGDPQSDPRPATGKAFLLGMVLRARGLVRGLDGYVRAGNLLDRRHDDPSSFPAKLPGLPAPSDFPNRGFEIAGGLTYSLAR
jgi:outer membrane cobalamin receptor